MCILLNADAWFAIKELPWALTKLGVDVSALPIIVPVGISYFTLQAIGYLRIWFPAIVQGPISRYHQLMPQLVRDMPLNIDQLPLSAAKLEVINDFYSLDVLTDNLLIAKYKDRLLDMELTDYDFDYSFEDLAPNTFDYSRTEMTMRISNNGFCEMPMHLDGAGKDQIYTPYMAIPDYYEKQAKVADDEKLPYEDDILKYVNKIIDLCEKPSPE